MYAWLHSTSLLGLISFLGFYSTNSFLRASSWLHATSFLRLARTICMSMPMYEYANVWVCQCMSWPEPYVCQPYVCLIAFHLTPRVDLIPIGFHSTDSGWNSKRVWSNKFYIFFPSLVWVPPIVGIPSTPDPNSTFQHCYNIYDAYILKQRSIRTTLEMHLFPAKLGAKYVPGPTEPPRMPNFQQMSTV